MEGKARSATLPFGSRRKLRTGDVLAPHSLRRKGKHFMRDCTDEEISMVIFKVDLKILRDHHETVKTKNEPKIENLQKEIDKSSTELKESEDALGSATLFDMENFSGTEEEKGIAEKENKIVQKKMNMINAKKKHIDGLKKVQKELEDEVDNARRTKSKAEDNARSFMGA